ncbi:hypothetical protein E7744_01765 [Citricoccus sp. SGAir0253]|uniref:hypothetical protein n=1 Tax=Citricoccus sp. SGAir0253 TaxID=2567881 RepID=UPI0010CD52E7|nr:hypothetical protein [Citricoccus sp. SGAir0253]QCU77088.1 hypothetical protein E7744_01765 [Citricoccus sp. SGAir0253]
MTARRRPDRTSPRAPGTPSRAGRPSAGHRPPGTAASPVTATARRAALALGGAAAAVVLAGCSLLPGNGTSQDQGDDPLPRTSAEGFVELPLYFVALNGDFPPGTTGRDVACGDLLVRVTTVPVRTEDPVASAIDFLLDDEQYEHGDPAVTNSLDPSEDGLRFVSSRVEGDRVTLELTGDVVSRSQCESYRLRAQLNRTAAAAAGVPDAEVLVDGVRIEDLLGLSPLELGEKITTPGGEPSPAASAGSSAGAEGTGTDPLVEIGDPDQADQTDQAAGQG